MTDPASNEAASSGPDRRKALALGVAAAGLAWAAPAVLSTDAAGAQSQQPSTNGVVAGSARACGALPDPGNGVLEISFEPAGGGTPIIVYGTLAGTYEAILPAGTWDASVRPSNRPDLPLVFYPGIVVVAGGFTAQNLNYNDPALCSV